MGELTHVAPVLDTEPKKLTRSFRRSNQVRTSPEALARQTALSMAAIAAFDDRATAMTFLHDSVDALGGRPLDVASESEAGLAACIAHLEAVALAR